MSRVYNFSAGPAVLPEEVLQEAADEMLDYSCLLYTSCLYKLPEKMYTLFGENVNLQNVVKTEGGGYHGLQENSTADL